MNNKITLTKQNTLTGEVIIIGRFDDINQAIVASSIPFGVRPTIRTRFAKFGKVSFVKTKEVYHFI